MMIRFIKAYKDNGAKAGRRQHTTVDTGTTGPQLNGESSVKREAGLGQIQARDGNAVLRIVANCCEEN